MKTEQRIEWLCRHSGGPQLEEFAVRAHVADVFARIKAAIRTGAAASDALTRDLDEFEEGLAAIGIDGMGTRGLEGYRRLPEGPGHPVVHAWICPHRVCSRVNLDKDGPPGSVQTCQVSGRPMERIRLDT